MRNFQETLEIEVNKQKLLEALRANKQAHIQAHAEAVENWKKDVKERISNAATDINQDNYRPFIKRSHKVFNIPAIPQSMEKDYDRAISMLEWHTEDTILLDQQKFNAFINDEWEWKSHWNNTNSMYLST